MVFTNGEISGLLFAPGLVQATLSHDCNLVRVVKFEHLFIWFSFLNLIMCFPIKFYIQTWYDHYRNTHFEVHIFELLRLRVKLINSVRAFALSQYTTSPPRALLPPLKSVSPVILAHSRSLWNHTSLVSKREKSTPLILTPALSLKRHSSSFKYEKVSNSQPTEGAQQIRYIWKQ